MKRSIFVSPIFPPIWPSSMLQFFDQSQVSHYDLEAEPPCPVWRLNEEPPEVLCFIVR